jgi:Ca-activated chloride channel family protein
VIFESPLVLFGLLLLPVIVAIEAWITRRDRDRTARLVSRPLWSRVLRRPPEYWRLARLALLLIGAAGIIVALARPQWGIVREKVEREGVDVVLVLDSSGSMATEDVPPNRFFLARQALASLISRLEGDRFGLVAFEGEAYPLAPLTLDADALGLFLDTMEPGIVPAPGTSLGVGLVKGLDLFVDKGRRNKVMVLVSDGEDLEGDVDQAIQRAKEAGVVVHTVGVGTEAGQPVPDFDADGRKIGFKHDASGAPVVSRLNMAALEQIARGTGGRAFRLTPSDPSLSALASAIEGMEQKSLAREFSYRRKERFQIPLAAGLVAIACGLLLPPPPLRRRRRVSQNPASPSRASRRRSTAAQAAAVMLALCVPGGSATVRAQGAPVAQPVVPQSAPAQPSSPSPADLPAGPAAASKPGFLDELLLRPSRFTDQGRKQWGDGNHPQALQDFERAARARAKDPRGRFNVADGLYKNGKFDEAATLFRSLGENADSPLAGPSQYNLGNALYQKKDYRGAVRAYRDALEHAPEDMDTRRNLELALRALKEQEEQQKQQQQRQNQQNKNQDQKNQKDQQQKNDSNSGQKQQQKNQPQNGGQQQPKTPEQQEDERFRQQTGMPKDRAMQLLDALQQNEKAEQRKLLLEHRGKARGGKDW